MSSVVVQVGQCGNQLGQEFWKLVHKDKSCQESLVYGHGSGPVSCVLVDSEPKVLQRIVDEDKGNVRKENVIAARRGRGGNWAVGYYGLSENFEDHLVQKTVEAVRKEAERCDSFSGVILMHSLCGGTGSGLGSKLVESLHDEFPLAHQMSCVVAPHATGESPLQNYNALLCMGQLQKYSDAIVLFHNDELLHRLMRRGRNPVDDVAVSLSQLNHHAAACLGGVFLPVESITTKSGYSIGLEPWEMLRSLCPMPTLKYLHLNTVARSKVNWESLASQLCHNVVKHDDTGHPFSSIALLCAARGDSTGSFLPAWKNVENKIKAGYNPVPWNPFPVDSWVGKNFTTVEKNVTAGLTVASNYSNIIEFASHVWTQAQEKYRAKAFLHWYWKYGCEETDFEEAFDSVATMAQDYADAVR